MNYRKGINPFHILLVENSINDALLTTEAFKEIDAPHNISVIYDGEEALSYLRREGEYANAPRPDLILLNLHLPKKSGVEVLAEIKIDERVKNIPVVVWTNSPTEEEILNTYQLRANAHVIKPIYFEDFIAIIKSIEGFWISAVAQPWDRQEKNWSQTLDQSTSAFELVNT